MAKVKVGKKLPVKFGSYSGGDNPGIMVTIQKDAFGSNRIEQLDNADRFLSRRSLNIRLVRGRRADGETQGKIFEDTDLIVVGDVSTGKMGNDRKTFNTKLSVDRSAIDCATLDAMSNSEGFMTINSIEELTDADAAAEADANDAERPLVSGEGGGTATAEKPARTRKKK